MDKNPSLSESEVDEFFGGGDDMHGREESRECFTVRQHGRRAYNAVIAYRIRDCW